MNEESSYGSRSLSESRGRVTSEVAEIENDSDDDNSARRQQRMNTDDVDNSPNNSVGVYDIGGKIDQPAFCLLDGIFLDPDGTNSDSGNKMSPKYQRITLPIRHLPSTLGRTHVTKDVSFVGIGTMKAISRQLCRIEYRTSSTKSKTGVYGQLQSKIPGTSELHYVDGNKSNVDGDDSVISIDNVPKDIITDGQHVIPKGDGFYVITVVGKNRIFVNNKRLEQGDTAYLYDGSKIKFSSFSLRFLLPKSKKPTGTIEIPNDEPVTSSSLTSNNHASSSNSITHDTAHGRKAQAMQLELDSFSTQRLLDLMSNAIDENVWDRKHQLIGAILSYRAVLDAAYAPDIVELSTKTKGEISRGEIMDWIAQSDKYYEWVEQMLSKMEQKSYQASITKGMIKADFKRTTHSGRYVKWLLPDSETIEIALKAFGETMKIKKKKQKQSSSKTTTSIGTKRTMDNDSNHDEVKRPKISIPHDSENNSEQNEDSPSDQSTGDHMNPDRQEVEEEDDDDDDNADDDNDDDDNNDDDDDNDDDNNDDDDNDNDDDDDDDDGASDARDKHNASGVEDEENDIMDDDDDEDKDDESSSESLGVSNQPVQRYPSVATDKAQSDDDNDDDESL